MSALLSLTQPVQVIFSRDQFARLQAIAQTQGESLDALIREAVKKVYLEHDSQERLEAVRRMAAMSLPVANWEQMERESLCDAAARPPANHLREPSF